MRGSTGLPETLGLEKVPSFIRQIPPCDDHSLVIFDADGTLWVNDVADDFTRWMMDRDAIPKSNWHTYMRIYRNDPREGCRYLLTFFQGMVYKKLSKFVEEFWKWHAHRQWIPEVLASLYHLADKAYPIWVVSGTPTDFLLPVKEWLPVFEVVGMDFEVDDRGLITGRHAGISCAGEGKAEKLIEMTYGRPIRFCCGNGSLDGPMMELAEVAWSVYPNPQFEELSRQKGWPILPRPSDFVEEEKFLLND